MPIDDYGARDGETLAGSAADFLGGEKGIEDFVANGGGNAAAGIGNGN